MYLLDSRAFSVSVHKSFCFVAVCSMPSISTLGLQFFRLHSDLEFNTVILIFPEEFQCYIIAKSKVATVIVR